MSLALVAPSPLDQRRTARTRAACRANRPVIPPELATAGIFYVATRAGREAMSRGWIVDHIQGLVDRHGFPPPLPSRRDASAAHVTAASRWPLIAVDAWFDGFLPPAAHGAILARHADTLDARAAAMGSIAA